MSKLDKTIVISAPLSDVFDYASQLEHFPSFLPLTGLQFLTHMHRGVGTRVRYNFNLGGKRILIECNLTKLEIDKSVEFHHTRGMACDWRLTFTGIEGGTQLRWEGEYEAPVGFVDKLLGRSASLQQAMEATLDNGLRKLKETLESG